MALTFFLKRNDLGPPIVVALLDGDRVPVDLTNIEEVRFHMRPRNTDTVVVDAAATVTDAGSGIVQYDWADGDTAELGAYDAEFEVTAGGVPTTFPNDRNITVIIRPDLA